jgi:hypothetical protein
VDFPDMKSITQAHKGKLKQHVKNAEESYFGAWNFSPGYCHFI